MGYYRGDYSPSGGYYRGDPFLGAAIGAAARFVGSRVIGRAGAAAGRIFGGGRAQRIQDIGTGMGVAETARWAQNRFGVTSTIPMIEPASRPGVGAAAPGRPTTALEKYDQRLKGFGKRRRGMNPLNPKALKRALRRAEGFEKFAKKTVNALYKTVDGRRVKTFKKTTRKR